MRIFDKINTRNIERREWQLWALALSVIIILAVGMALLMYPAVFSSQVVINGHSLRELFFGFCAVTALLVGYLVDRQIVVTQLRKQLQEEQKQMIRMRLEASTDLLGSLPGIEHFHDQLAMEYRRASSTQQPLSLLLVRLNISSTVQDPAEIQASCGDAAKTLTRKLRGEDSIFRFAQTLFGIILPGVSASTAYRVADRLTDGLHDAAGASSRYSAEVRLFNYPEHAATARELAEAVRDFTLRFGQAGTQESLAEAASFAK